MDINLNICQKGNHSRKKEKKKKKHTLEVTFYITCQEKLKLDKVAASSLLKKEKEKKILSPCTVFFIKYLNT